MYKENLFEMLTKQNKFKATETGSCETIKVGGVVFDASEIKNAETKGWARSRSGSSILIPRGASVLLGKPSGKGTNPNHGHCYIEGGVKYIADTYSVDNIPLHDGYRALHPTKRILLEGGSMELLVF